MVEVALSIAGSDPSGGAGIQADLKTFQTHGVYGEAVVSLLTVQNSLGVREVVGVDEGLIRAQIDALLTDMPPDAIKTGALPSPRAVTTIAAVLDASRAPLVVDPVLGATRGASFGEGEGMLSALRDALIPRALLVTPNTDEARALTGIVVSDVESAARAGEALCKLGAAAALVKGGHLEGDPTDVLVIGGRASHAYTAPRIASRHTHGTGCALSAAITARLARGYALEEAVVLARDWLRRAIAGAPRLGAGAGPIDHRAPCDIPPR